jgi:hypothetical protein
MKHFKKQLIETLLHLAILATLYRYPTNRNSIFSTSHLSHTRDPLLLLNRHSFDVNSSIDHLIRLKETSSNRITGPDSDYFDRLVSQLDPIPIVYRRFDLLIYPAFAEYTGKFGNYSTSFEQRNQEAPNYNIQATDNLTDEVRRFCNFFRDRSEFNGFP